MMEQPCITTRITADMQCFALRQVILREDNRVFLLLECHWLLTKICNNFICIRKHS